MLLSFEQSMKVSSRTLTLSLSFTLSRLAKS